MSTKFKLTMLLLMCAVMTVVLVARFNTAEASQSHWSQTMDPSKDGQYYTMSLFVLKPETTTNKVAVIKFKHVEGWKWNKQYPNKFISNSEYKVLAKHVDLPSEGETQVWLLFKPEAKDIQVQAKYSFCSKSQCLVFNRKISFFNITP